MSPPSGASSHLDQLAMKSILIVDDEFDSRRALEILLELQGYEVTSAASGHDALAMLREKEFDVILTDWMMPVMSGGELISRIRAERLAEGIPIIVLTAASESVRSARPPCARVMGKPLEFPRLLEAITELGVHRHC
jgi:CheY-like chemotaxis protein